VPCHLPSLKRNTVLLFADVGALLLCRLTLSSPARWPTSVNRFGQPSGGILAWRGRALFHAATLPNSSRHANPHNRLSSSHRVGHHRVRHLLPRAPHRMQRSLVNREIVIRPTR